MTIEEVANVMDVLEVSYPKFYAWSDDDKRAKAAILWAEMFSEDSLPVVLAAVKALIACNTKDSPPTIGQIKEYILHITRPEEMTEMKAWQLVSKALQNGYYGAEKEFAKLPMVIQSIVGSPSQLRQWAMIETDELQTVTQSNFMRSYRARAAQVREYEKLPESVKSTMHEIAEHFDMNRLIGDGNAQ